MIKCWHVTLKARRVFNNFLNWNDTSKKEGLDLLMMMENDINSLANSSRKKNDIWLPHAYLHMIKSKTLMALGPWGVKWLGQNNFGRVISYAINALTRHSKIYMYFAHSQLKLSHYHWKCYLFQARPKYYAYFENAWSWGHSLARLLFFERQFT